MFYYKMVLQYIAKDFVIIMGYYEYWGTVLYLTVLSLESVKVLCLHEMLLTVMLHNALLNDAFNGAKETILLWFKNDKPLL